MEILAILMKIVILLALLAMSGCTFHRTVVNAHQGSLKTDWIQPGETTFEEVVERFGLPPMIQGVTGYTSDALHYVTVDEFKGRLEVGWIVKPTFERAMQSYSNDLLISFDKQGVVSLVSKTRMTTLPSTGTRTVEVLDYREAP